MRRAGSCIYGFCCIQWYVVVALDEERQRKQDVGASGLVERADVRGEHERRRCLECSHAVQQFQLQTNVLDRHYFFPAILFSCRIGCTVLFNIPCALWF